jgi:hypothetical protein
LPSPAFALHRLLWRFVSNAGDNEAVKIAGALEKNSTMKCINLANNHIKVCAPVFPTFEDSVAKLISMLLCQMNGANALAKVLQGQGHANLVFAAA